MRCQRCGDDTRVDRHEVDGFRGYLCQNCHEAWDRLTALSVRGP